MQERLNSLNICDLCGAHESSHREGCPVLAGKLPSPEFKQALFENREGFDEACFGYRLDTSRSLPYRLGYGRGQIAMEMTEQ
jgi:hypothetical protein